MDDSGHQNIQVLVQALSYSDCHILLAIKYTNDWKKNAYKYIVKFRCKVYRNETWKVIYLIIKY